MNVGDIVTVMTRRGEYVGALKENNGDNVIGENPILVTMGDSGLALADGLTATGNVPSEVHFYNVTFMTLSHPDVIAAHNQAISENNG